MRRRSHSIPTSPRSHEHARRRNRPHGRRTRLRRLSLPSPVHGRRRATVTVAAARATRHREGTRACRGRTRARARGADARPRDGKAVRCGLRQDAGRTRRARASRRERRLHAAISRVASRRVAGTDCILASVVVIARGRSRASGARGTCQRGDLSRLRAAPRARGALLFQLRTRAGRLPALRCRSSRRRRPLLRPVWGAAALLTPGASRTRRVPNAERGAPERRSA